MGEEENKISARAAALEVYQDNKKIMYACVVGICCSLVVSFPHIMAKIIGILVAVGVFSVFLRNAKIKMNYLNDKYNLGFKPVMENIDKLPE